MEAIPYSSTPSLVVAPQFPAAYQRGSQRIALPYFNRTIFIAADDVICLQGEGNYTFLHTRDRKRYLVSKTLKEFEKMLGGSIFLRVHKSYIVNLAYVQRDTYSKERQVRLADGREVTISRRRMKDITRQLVQYGQLLLN